MTETKGICVVRVLERSIKQGMGFNGMDWMRKKVRMLGYPEGQVKNVRLSLIVLCRVLTEENTKQCDCFSCFLNNLFINLQSEYKYMQKVYLQDGDVNGI